MESTIWRPAIAVGLICLLAGCGAEAPAELAEAAAENEPVELAPMIEIPNALTPLPGILVGGQPTPEALEQAAAAGYRTVINMRRLDEPGFEWEGEQVVGLGMFYTQIPVDGADGLDPDLVQSLADALYAPDALPAMVHCASGNRVGAMLALKAAWIDGAAPQEALQLGVDAGLTRLHDRVATLLEQGPAEQGTPQDD